MCIRMCRMRTMRTATEAARRSGPVARALAVLRDEGFPVFWFKLLSALGVYRRLFILARPLAEPIGEFVPEVPVVVGMLTRAEVDAYVALRPEAESAAIVGRFDSGCLCFVARHEGRAVGACWIATGRAYSAHLACDLPLSAGDAYLFDAYTLPAYRGRGVAPALCAHQLRYCRDAGWRRAIRATSPENRAALRAHAKSGFRAAAVIGRVMIGSWRRFFSHPCDR